MRDQRSCDAPDRQDKPNWPGEQAEQHRQPATELNDDRQDPSRFHHWQTLLDKHCLRGRRPEQFDRTADEEQAEIFARVVMKDKPDHSIYNTGGHTISLGDLADIVREFLPDAQITFDHENGGRERSGNFMIDNSRVVTEFGMQFRPYRERVLQIINEVRADEGKPPITTP